MKLMPRADQAVLFLLILYCADLAWKLANWGQLTGSLSGRMIAGALTIRFAVMTGLLWVYLRMRKNAKKPS